MKNKISIELVKHRLEQAKEDLEAAEILFDNKKFKSANNRAYYSIFHSIRAVLALEPIDFKKHKTVISYFNKNYINTEIFSKKLGHKIAEASKLREDSDYDDYIEDIEDIEDTTLQIETAEQVYNECVNYIETKVYKLNLQKEKDKKNDWNEEV